jgi:hypothetical protein
MLWFGLCSLDREWIQKEYVVMSTALAAINKLLNIRECNQVLALPDSQICSTGRQAD